MSVHVRWTHRAIRTAGSGSANAGRRKFTRIALIVGVLMKSSFLPIFTPLSITPGQFRGNRIHMEAYHFTLLFHFLGLGLLCTSLFGGWIIQKRVKAAADWKKKSETLTILWPIGLLSPGGSALLLITGIGNLIWIGYGWSLPVWLQVKLAVFGAAVIAGIFGGTKAKQRGKLVFQLASGNAPDNAGSTIASLDRQAGILYILQFVFLLTILLLSIVKP